MALSKIAFDKIMGKYKNFVNEEKMSFFLKNFPFFAQLKENYLLSIIIDLKYAEYKKNEVIYTFNEPVRKVYFIHNGEVELLRRVEIGSNS